jgi:pilus assembly protein CpaE
MISGLDPRIPVTVAVAIGDQALRKQIVGALRSLRATIADEDCWQPETAELVAGIARLHTGIVLLGLGGLNGDPGELLTRIAALKAPPRVIAVNDSADPVAILKAMRSGAAEFIYPPFESGFAEAFNRVLADCLKQQPAPEASLGRTIGFVSAKGGCGATTLACHAADYLRRVHRKCTLLADLDLCSGMAGVLLQISPHYSVADALQNLHRLDLTLWKAMVSVTPDGLDVIPAPPPPYDLGPSSRKLSHLLRFWRSQYEITVADFGHGFTPLLADLVEWIDVLAVVSTNEVHALRQAKLILQGLEQRNQGAKRVRLVVNRMPKRPEIQVPELERIIGFPIQATLPNDYKSLAEAYAHPSLIEHTSFLGAHMAELAAVLAGIPAGRATKHRRFAIFAWYYCVINN